MRLPRLHVGVTLTALHIVQQSPPPESFPTIEHPVGQFTCSMAFYIVRLQAYKDLSVSLRWME